MPWDEVSYWVSEHLNNKLGLHFSLVSGSGDQDPVKYQKILSLNMTPTLVALDLIMFFYKVQ